MALCDPYFINCYPRLRPDEPLLSLPGIFQPATNMKPPMTAESMAPPRVFKGPKRALPMKISTSRLKTIAMTMASMM